MAVTLDLADIQGNVLRPYGHQPGFAAHFLLHFETGDGGRRLLADLAPHVTPASSMKPPEGLNISVAHSGFQALGVKPEILDSFPESFRVMSEAESARDRARTLGDVGRSDPDNWEDGLGSGHVHAIVAVHALEGRYPAAVDRVRARVAAAPGVTVVAVQETWTQTNMVEHFGFADGASQPAVEGVAGSAAAARGGGVALADSQWRPVRAGEFVLGYPDEDGAVADAPDPVLVRNGSYVVWRKLQQHVGRFRARLLRAAEQADLPLELMAAKAVGRWRDGVPLELDPWRSEPPDLTGEVAEIRPNDFRYLPHDRAGEVCPRGAHIRRANPRDSIEFGTAVKETGLLTARHRIIRRGMPYGDPLADGAKDGDDPDRGLLFICLQADIERQFEVIQRAWCCDGDAFFLGDDQDFLLSNQNASGKMVVPMRDGPPRFVETEPDLVVTRGMEYLFAPGVTALKNLAEGRFG